jgi:hypothetical protein
MPRSRHYSINPYQFRELVRKCLTSLEGEEISVKDLKDMVITKLAEMNKPEEYSKNRFYTAIRQFDKSGEIEKREVFERDPTKSVYDQFIIRHVPRSKGQKAPSYYHM